MRRHRLAVALATAVSTAALVVPAASASGNSAGPTARPEAAKLVGMLSCTGKVVTKPTGIFIISCADANAELSATHWTTWTATAATGVTRFGLNLCNPNCASSRISYFPGSTVRLSGAVATKHGKLFSSLVVTYKLHGKSERFPFSWKGDPSF